jgi:hypothetical protein
MRYRNHALALAALCALLAAAPPGAARAAAAPADAAAPDDAPAHVGATTTDVLPAGTLLDGRAIYERVLANRFKATFQKERIVSTDPGGTRRETELWSRWKDYRDPQGRPTETVLSKTLVKYTAPRDVRNSGYLIIRKLGEPADQFVYLKSSRRVRRVSMGESIMGTDFSLEDIVPRSIEASDYVRTVDEKVGDVPCYVVEVTPKPDSDSEYSRLLVYVEKEHFVMLRTRYWSRDGVEVKEFNAPASTLEEVRGVWIAREGTMKSLINGTTTTLYIDEIDPQAPTRDSIFSVSNLQRNSR